MIRALAVGMNGLLKSSILHVHVCIINLLALMVGVHIRAGWSITYKVEVDILKAILYVSCQV